ncbi:hypothetical protein H5410_058515 [Solanum commersonii]|uniref:Uncharacterized protein n=1 Tax=Solanum commersonii TaxID=4109 RepID=A0A9J5WSW9_SOLCO|nr:hypothetical protein H5410_058515 [Solanum commersonii]
MEVDSPSRLNMFFKLLGVMYPSISYIPNAPINSLSLFLSSSIPSISFVKSSMPNNPSPSESDSLTAISASSTVSSPPTAFTHLLNSAGDTFPSPFSSKYVNTLSNSPLLLLPLLSLTGTQLVVVVAAAAALISNFSKTTLGICLSFWLGKDIGLWKNVKLFQI